MKVTFADTFFESISDLVHYDSWYYKTWEFFRRTIPNFFGNVWKFRKSLASFKWYDYRYNLEMFRDSLKITSHEVEVRGNEVDESRLKKVAKMNRAIELLTNIIDDNFIDQAEAELGELMLRDWEFEDCADHPGCSQLKDNDTPEEKAHNTKVFTRARELEKLQNFELWEIMKGQNYDEFTTSEDWEAQYDGSGIQGWWD